MSSLLTRRDVYRWSVSAALALRAGTLLAQENEKRPQDYVTPAAIELKDIYTFLVLGMDTRITGEELNTDVIMVSRVDLNARTVRTASIPRDLYVEIPGSGFHKINQAFKSGAENGDDQWMLGMQATRNTLEYNFGISIDATISVRFEGVEQIVDLFGGVTFNNPYELNAGSLHMPAGEVHVDGRDALRVMRSRNQDMDDGRVMRQQLILTALLDEVKDPANISKLPGLVEVGRDLVITDIPVDVQLQLLVAVATIPAENVYWATFTDQLEGEIISSGEWIYHADWEVLPVWLRAFLNGEL